MRKLDVPLTDDGLILKQLRMSNAASATAIRPHLDDIRDRYAIYEQHGGNPWHVALDNGFAAIRDDLHKLYQKPLAALGYIKSLRSSLQGACPVCGRDGLGTLDHYLPKADYSEFSFFSRNLVPACDRCNNARGNVVMGDQQGERPPHPYFDAFLANRVMTVKFEPDWRAPNITAIPFDVDGEELAIVQWHIDHVIRPAGIDNYLRHLWATLVAEPNTFLNDATNRPTVLDALDRQIRMETATGKSQNGWKACFYHGLILNTDALDYLASLV